MPFDIPYGAPIGIETAQKAIAAAAAEAKKHNWKMSISVADPGGNLIAHATYGWHAIRLDRHLPGQGAYRRVVPRPSGAFQNAINNGGPNGLSLLSLSGGVASEGGFPIVVDGKLVGAIGCSGGIFTQDAATCKGGLEALGIK